MILKKLDIVIKIDEKNSVCAIMFILFFGAKAKKNIQGLSSLNVDDMCVLRCLFFCCGYLISVTFPLKNFSLLSVKMILA